MSHIEIRQKLLACGWYEKDFLGNGVVALNPFYPNFTLGISEKWINAGWFSEIDRWIYVYPTQDTLEKILEEG